VRSPEVKKGEAEIEEHGAFYSGPGEDERLWQTHELEGKYGITERFEVILEGEFEQPIDEDFEAKAIELGGQYEIVQREGDGLGLAFRTLYEFALQDGSPDEILFGPVAKLVKGRNSATINMSHEALPSCWCPYLRFRYTRVFAFVTPALAADYYVALRLGGGAKCEDDAHYLCTEMGWELICCCEG
jgi:hypothetical protein